MKKFMFGVAQVVAYFVFYEVVVWVVGFLVQLLVALLLSIPFFSKLLGSASLLEGLLYTIYPVACAFCILILLNLCFRKTRVYIGSAIAMFVILVSTHVYHLICSIVDYGLISWGFGNTLWQSLILCAVLVMGIMNLTDYEVVRKKEESVKDNGTDLQ